MTMATTRRFWTLPGVALIALVALGAFSDARAGPPDTFSAMRAWDPRPSQGLDFKTEPTVRAKGLKRPAAPGRLQPKFSATDEFRKAYLTPRMLAAFPHENTVATADLLNPSSNPVMTDPAALALVEKGAIRAMTDAFKLYAIEGLGIDRWSLRVTGRNGGSRVAPADDTRGVRLHLGFSRLAPRADLLIPIAAGRVVVSADVRGHVRTTFEPKSSTLRLAADVDVPDHTATVRLGLQF
jgi:hypothetical protein